MNQTALDFNPISNRNRSYGQIEHIGEKQQAVLDVIIKYPAGISDRDVALLLGWPINRVTGRRNELYKMHKVVNIGNRYDEQTNRMVTVWKAVPE
jgi:hypothetical protein